MKKITDKMRLDWMENDWCPRTTMREVIANYELNDVTIRQAIDAAIRASRREGR